MLLRKELTLASSTYHPPDPIRWQSSILTSEQLRRESSPSLATAGAALAPLFTGASLAVPSLGLPFLLAGGLKIIYDLSIFAVFRKVKPPEEAN